MIHKHKANRPLDGGVNTIIHNSTGYLHNPQILKILQSGREKLVERGALAFSGARNANLKIHWSAER